MLNIVVRIRLDPDAGVTNAELQAAINTWEPAIESTWSGQHQIILDDGDCKCLNYTLDLNVQFVDNNEHHTVRVERGPARSNMTLWHHDDPGGTAAHEVGHMLGHIDEYADATCPDRVVTNDGSIMQTIAGAVLVRHYGIFADWLSRRTCCDYIVS